jgi:hypothetical protein
MKNNIRKLWIEFAFSEVFGYFLYISEKGIFFEFKIDITFSKPCFG